MKSFLKYVFATLVGLMLFGLVGFFIMMGALGSLLSSSSTTPTVKNQSVLKIELDQAITEQSHDFDFSGFNPLGGKPDFSGSVGLRDLIAAINAAKDDDKIEGIWINYDGASLGMATAEALRNALKDFKQSGKFIYAYSDSYTQGAYYLASVADSVFLQPQGMVQFQGLSANIMFYTNFLKKVGVEMQVIRHGQFKSAVEPYFRTDMSEANRRQYEVLFGSMWRVITDEVSASRNMSKDRLNAVADSLLGFTATGSLNAGLVDVLSASSDMEGHFLPARLGKADSVPVNVISVNDYIVVANAAENKAKAKAKDKIAVIYAEGEIKNGEGSNTEIGTGLAEQIRNAVKDKSVKALVLRVNSPGGSVLTADVIYQEMMKAKAKMPVIASYGDYAASGGYYISCMADKIYAEPNTLTGSIGVFGTIPNAQKLLTEKLGFTFDGVSTNKNSSALKGITRPMNDYETAVMQKSIEEIYAGFIGKVAEGRNKTPEQIDEIGQGRVWSGSNAIEIGLVDELGGLDKAIAYAAEQAGLQNYKLEFYPKSKNKVEQLMGILNGKVSADPMEAVASAYGTEGVEAYSLLRDLAGSTEPQMWMRMPEIFIIR